MGFNCAMEKAKFEPENGRSLRMIEYETEAGMSNEEIIRNLA